MANLNKNQEKKLEISSETWEKITKWSNEELKKTLTTDYKRSFWGGWDTEDEKLVNQNERVRSEYKNPNYTSEFLIDEDTWEDEIIDAIDKKIKNKTKEKVNERDKLEKWKKYNWKILDFDRYWNAIIIFDDIEEEGMLYKWQKMWLNIWDEKKFAYIWENKNKTKYIFSLNHHKNRIILKSTNERSTPPTKIKRGKDLTK